MPQKALITGITGQDGSYLAEFLLAQGYQVFGMSRRTSTDSRERLRGIADKVEILEGDLGDTSSLIRVLRYSQPNEVYNLAAMSFVPAAFAEPVATGNINALGVARMLEGIRLVNEKIKFYQASTSEMFGKAEQPVLNEESPFHPRSPYGVAKLYAHYLTVNYREAYGLFTCSGILFNHESPRRGLEFVTRKITNSVARIYLGRQDYLTLGDLEARRDWGFAGDYVKAMWLMLQQERPDDYVVGSGEAHSVREFVEEAFRCVGITDWERYVKTDPQLYRPAEVPYLVADASKARRVLGWQPEVSFPQLVRMMVEHDIAFERGK